MPQAAGNPLPLSAAPDPPIVHTLPPPSSPPSKDPRDTPAMRQYARFKALHPDCLLLFRIGDFYELFDDDAVTISKALGLTLTQRTTGIPMAGVPVHALDNYLRRLINAGFRVAICDQIQDAAQATGIIDRAVTRVLSPGTLVDESLLDESRPNRIAAIQFTSAGDDAPAVLALIELSTGEFSLLTLPAPRIADEIARLAPSEILYVESADGSIPPRVARLKSLASAALTPRPAWTFRLDDAAQSLRTHFSVATLAGFALTDADPLIGPAGALLRFLHDSQPASAEAPAPIRHLRPPRKIDPDSFLLIDSASLRSLEIDRTLRSDSFDGSLLSVLQRAITPMGKRLLRHWLAFPLRDLSAISARHRAVAEFLADDALFSSLASTLSSIQDIARIVGRLGMRRATPRDLVALGRSLAALPAIASLLQQRHALAHLLDLLAPILPPLLDLSSSILSQCIDSPPAHLRDGGLFRDGFDPELDSARALQADASSWLASFQQKLVLETSIPSLKVGYNRVFGYYIEITNAHSSKIPSHFIRRQTLRNAERYVTADLQDFQQKVLTAESRALQRELDLFDALTAAAAALSDPILLFADLIAQLDVLRAFADSARRFNYVRPNMVPEPLLEILQGRHPVLDHTLANQFVPNDCALGSPAPSLALITGPNMAGKSTFIRQVALIVLMAHAGAFVPAASATIGLTDRIFTRIGASDEIHAGQSTFMVEMTETALILNHASKHSLVILDEIGRGTSTLDGLALAWAVAESIADINCRALFATHYHEITDLPDSRPNVANLHVSVREWNDQIIFLHRILPGRTNRSYGIHVAKIAGLPRATIARASQLLDSLAVHSSHHPSLAASSASITSSSNSSADLPVSASLKPNQQLALFTQYLNHPVIEELKSLNLSSLSPLQAFDLLRSLHSRAGSNSPSP